MSGAPDALILDLVEWVAKAPRPYAEVIEAWHTSCTRLTVWEDALERGLVERTAPDHDKVFVVATRQGRDFLEAKGRTGRAGAVCSGVSASGGREPI